MTEPLLLLRLLQHGDSFFPSGAVSFSWGLETLCADGVICSDRDVEAFVRGQLAHRWFHFDRSIITAAAAASLSDLVAIDRLAEARTLCAEFRSGSRRSGMGLLAAHAELQTEGAREYMALVREGAGKAHLAAMQGFLWSRRGIPASEAAVLSAHGLCVGFLGAAIRLGVVGHIGAQKILRSLHAEIGAMVEQPVVDITEIHSFTPQTEIAGMRHEIAQARTFAN